LYAQDRRNERQYGPAVGVLAVIEIFNTKNKNGTSRDLYIIKNNAEFANHAFNFLKQWASCVKSSYPVDCEAKLLPSPLSRKGADMSS
jgi:hypothetical protein